MLIIGDSGSRKANALLNLISHQEDNGNIYLDPNNPYEAKCQLLTSKGKGSGLKHCNDSEAFLNT